MRCCNILWVLGLVMVLAACNGSAEMDMGGGESGTGHGTPTKVEYQSTTAVGEITAFGSIFVNGIEFETDDAEIWVDGVKQPNQDALQLGMVVEVVGTVNDDRRTGVAQKVMFSQWVIGPVSEVVTRSQSHKELLVLGQRIAVSGNTSFYDVTEDEIAVGQVIAVSGFDDGAGAWNATWIKKKSDEITDLTEVRLTGAVTVVNANERVIQVNDQIKVDIDMADISGLGTAGPRVGDRVEIHGHLRPGNDKLSASRVRPREQQGAQLDQRTQVVRLEGLVSDFSSDASFRVLGHRVDASLPAITVGDAADLADGVRVRVSGKLNNVGVLVVDELIIQPMNTSVRMAAPIDDIERTASATVLRMMSNTVLISANTKLWQGGLEGQTNLSVTELRVGDWVEMGGTLQGDKIAAYHLARRTSEPTVMLQGAVQRVSGNVITLLGVDVDISAASLGDGPQPRHYDDRSPNHRDDNRRGSQHRPPPSSYTNLSDGINVGEVVRVIGTATSNRSIQATSVYAGD